MSRKNYEENSVTNSQYTNVLSPVPQKYIEKKVYMINFSKDCNKKCKFISTTPERIFC